MLRLDHCGVPLQHNVAKNQIFEGPLGLRERMAASLLRLIGDATLSHSESLPAVQSLVDSLELG